MMDKTETIKDPNASSAIAGDHSGLAAVLETHRGENHAIVLQEFPDPDAIASGFAHQVICRAYNIQTTLLYCGRISHQQNIALVKLLGIDLVRYDPSMDMKEYDGAVFLDNQGTTTGSILAALEKNNIPAVIVIDHHEVQERLQPRFTDIRPKIGANSSIYAEYLKEGIIGLNAGDKSHVIMATALTHGIITDTGGFVYARAEDFQAAAFLARYRDSDLLAQIMNQARSRQTMKVIQKALGSREFVESFSVAGVGYLRAEDRDAIPQAADFLLTEENIHTALVYGIVSGENWDEAIIGSMRTNRITIDPDQFIKDVFGKDASGQYFGGGKMSAGGFHIPIGFLSGGEDTEFREHKWEVFNKQILQKIMNKIGVKPDKTHEDD